MCLNEKTLKLKTLLLHGVDLKCDTAARTRLQGYCQEEGGAWKAFGRVCGAGSRRGKGQSCGLRMSYFPALCAAATGREKLPHPALWHCVLSVTCCNWVQGCAFPWGCFLLTKKVNLCPTCCKTRSYSGPSDQPFLGGMWSSHLFPVYM